MTDNAKPETLLETLADETADERDRAAAADALAAKGLRVVMHKGNRGPATIEKAATMRMWQHPARLETWGRDHLPIVDPHDALPRRVYELDPFDMAPLDDGYNSATGADWKDVKLKWQILVRWAVQRDRLQHVDPCELAAQLAKGKPSTRMQRCKTEATQEELAAAAAELRGERRATAYLPQQATTIRVAGVVVGKGPSQVFRGPVGAIQVGNGNVANVSMGASGIPRLSTLLSSAFSASELRRFVATIAPEVVTSIAWEGSIADVSFRVAEALRARGYTNLDEFWEALVAVRPGRGADIRALSANPRI